MNKQLHNLERSTILLESVKQNACDHVSLQQLFFWHVTCRRVFTKKTIFLTRSGSLKKHCLTKSLSLRTRLVQKDAWFMSLHQKNFDLRMHYPSTEVHNNLKHRSYRFISLQMTLKINLVNDDCYTKQLESII